MFAVHWKRVALQAGIHPPHTHTHTFWLLEIPFSILASKFGALLLSMVLRDGDASTVLTW